MEVPEDWTKPKCCETADKQVSCVDREMSLDAGLGDSRVVQWWEAAPTLHGAGDSWYLMTQKREALVPANLQGRTRLLAAKVMPNFYTYRGTAKLGSM